MGKHNSGKDLSTLVLLVPIPPRDGHCFLLSLPTGRCNAPDRSQTGHGSELRESKEKQKQKQNTYSVQSRGGEILDT